MFWRYLSVEDTSFQSKPIYQIFMSIFLSYPYFQVHLNSLVSIKAIRHSHSMWQASHEVIYRFSPPCCCYSYSQVSIRYQFVADQRHMKLSTSLAFPAAAIPVPWYLRYQCVVDHTTQPKRRPLMSPSLTYFNFPVLIIIIFSFIFAISNNLESSGSSWLVHAQWLIPMLPKPSDYHQLGVIFLLFILCILVCRMVQYQGQVHNNKKLWYLFLHDAGLKLVSIQRCSFELKH